MHGVYARAYTTHRIVKRFAWRDHFTHTHIIYYRYDNGRLISSWKQWYERRGEGNGESYPLRRISSWEAFNYVGL